MQDNPPESLNPTFNDGAAYERLMGRWSLLAGAQFLDWLAPAPGQAWLDDAPRDPAGFGIALDGQSHVARLFLADGKRDAG